jgi:cereblon
MAKFDTSVLMIEQLRESLMPNEADLLLCRCCTTAITQNREKVKVGVSHDFRFSNLANIIYSIGCFRNAHGCAIAGIPTVQESWFGGYHWQLASCSVCQEHLGWYFQNTQQRFFFGLIKDRLINTIP